MVLPRVLKLLPVVALLCAALLAGGCGSSSERSDETEESRTNLVADVEREPAVELPKDKTPNRLVVRTLREGTGIEARKGDALVTKFVAKYTDGQRFESSWDKGESPFIFRLGTEQSNPAWERGLPGMRVGGKRELVVPSDLASRFGPLPEGNDLVYIVELIGILPPDLVEREEPEIEPPKKVPVNSLLRVRDLIEGTGAAAKPGDVLTVEHIGINFKGKEIVNTWKKSEPFRFELGAEESPVGPGWDRELQGMRVGGRREFVIPTKLQRASDAPENQAVVYVIDLIGITEPDDVRR